MRLIHVVGARPNFMKVAPVMRALAAHKRVVQVLVHTGQHYDANMSGIFFRQLGIPAPDINLNVGSGSHARQTAEIMMRFEEVLLEHPADLVLVYGDINSTVAAALVSAKLGIPVAHVEAGLRSFDRSMPEELNRLVTDQLADLLLTPSIDGNANLDREGIGGEKVAFVGNVMIDTLVRLLPKADAKWPELAKELGIRSNNFGLVTLHRPSNVDDPEVLPTILGALEDIGRQIPLVFPMHPRTRDRIEQLGLSMSGDHCRIIAPRGYTDFVSLQKNARFVITDSGGVQEETTYLGVPCFTLRENTERPVTIDVGTNVLIGRDLELLRQEVGKILEGIMPTGSVPDLWDGRAGERVASAVASYLEGRLAAA